MKSFSEVDALLRRELSLDQYEFLRQVAQLHGPELQRRIAASGLSDADAPDADMAQLMYRLACQLAGH